MVFHFWDSKALSRPFNHLIAKLYFGLFMSGPQLEGTQLIGKDYIFVILTSQHLAEVVVPAEHATGQILGA